MNIHNNSTIQSLPEVRTPKGDENSGVNLQNEGSTTPSQKRKRCAWSVKEKLEAIENYEKSKSKHSTAKHIGCTRFQLTERLKTKEELKNLQSLNKGKPLIYNKFHILCFSF
jgi:phosphopantetheinyl transferase